MLRVGIVGWRGVVGSVLVQRMREEKDFDHVEPVFFSTTQAGGKGPDIGKAHGPVLSATDLESLKQLPVIIACQGSDYTSEIHPQLRAAGWRGYWIDAANALRMKDDAVIILDPVNLPTIKEGFAAGKKDFIGGNCTVSLMLMGMAGLLQRTGGRIPAGYRRIPAAGRADSGNSRKDGPLGEVANRARRPGSDALEIDRRVTAALRNGALPKKRDRLSARRQPLPWIDRIAARPSREEGRPGEGNKIIGRSERRSRSRHLVPSAPALPHRQ